MWAFGFNSVACRRPLKYFALALENTNKSVLNSEDCFSLFASKSCGLSLDSSGPGEDVFSTLGFGTKND